MKSFARSLAISVLFVFVGLQALALNISTGIKKVDNQFLKVNSFVCDNDETGICFKICADLKQCQLIEKPCLNCAGTTWGFLRSLFTSPSKEYTSFQELSVDKVSRYILQDQFTLIDAQSVFNYYTPLQARSLVENMKAFCPVETENVIFSVGLNKERIPVALDFVVCQKSEEKDLFMSVRKSVAEINTDAFGNLVQTLK